MYVYCFVLKCLMVTARLAQSVEHETLKMFNGVSCHHVKHLPHFQMYTISAEDKIISDFATPSGGDTA